MSRPGLDRTVVSRLVAWALAEDLGERGDRTTESLVEDDRQGEARILARQDLVLAGLPVAQEVFRQLDDRLEWNALRRDGERVSSGSPVAEISGRARPILAGERTALNFLMRMSGIASAASAAVKEIAGTGARILDTRKTAPGLRLLDKYAVAAGGAQNHRLGLHDAVMIKDTHLGVSESVGSAVRRVLAAGHPPATVTAEVRTPAELEEALAAGAGRALLDNMSLDAIRTCVAIGKGKIVLEASGGMVPGKLLPVAGTGVDFISLGYLTHSAPAADLSMELERPGG